MGGATQSDPVLPGGPVLPGNAVEPNQPEPAVPVAPADDGMADWESDKEEVEEGEEKSILDTQNGDSGGPKTPEAT